MFASSTPESFDWVLHGLQIMTFINYMFDLSFDGRTCLMNGHNDDFPWKLVGNLDRKIFICSQVYRYASEKASLFVVDSFEAVPTVSQVPWKWKLDFIYLNALKALWRLQASLEARGRCDFWNLQKP